MEYQKLLLILAQVWTSSRNDIIILQFVKYPSSEASNRPNEGWWITYLSSPSSYLFWGSFSWSY